MNSNFIQMNSNFMQSYYAYQLSMQQGAKKNGRWNERLSLVRCVMRSETGARALETEG